MESKSPRIIITASSPDIIIPNTAYDNDSGYDIYSPIDITLESNIPVKINSQLRISIDSPLYSIYVENRSSMGIKGIIITTKVIDNGYTGFIYINMVNITKETLYIKKNEKIAQFIIKKLYKPKIDVVSNEEFDDIFKEKSMRKDNKFGSSNNKLYKTFDDFLKK